MEEFNDFCSDLLVGNILYNLDNTNRWPRYLLVIDITPTMINGQPSYSILLLGLSYNKGIFEADDQCIKLTSEHAHNALFLKIVGLCKFNLKPEIIDSKVNQGLITIYNNTNLKDFIQKLNIRKPHLGKYGKDGKPIIKKTSNF